MRSALPRECQSKAERLAKELANEGLLTWLMKTGQIHVSLNPHRKREINELIETYFEKQSW
ncbi:hypothetical protein HY992_04485 [Candidatus Micrarchaeota archaeon]|nr:hypothetical protein [Candidatus Micrarchaeota archaeon]